MNNDLRKDAEATLGELGTKFKILYIGNINSYYVVMAIVGKSNKVVRGSGATINECCKALLQTAILACSGHDNKELKYIVS